MRLSLVALLAAMCSGCAATYNTQIVGRNLAAPARPAPQNVAIVHDPVTTPGAIEVARIHVQGDAQGNALGCQDALREGARKLGADVIFVSESKGSFAPTCDGIAYALPANAPTTTSAPAASSPAATAAAP